jgi:hypothetical protein
MLIGLNSNVGNEGTPVNKALVLILEMLPVVSVRFLTTSLWDVRVDSGGQGVAKMSNIL